MAENVNNDLSERIEIEFTLEDTYDHLKELEKEFHEQIEELVNICANNHVETVSPEFTIQDIHLKQDKMIQELLKNSDEYDPRIRPLDNTVDLYKLINWELEQETANIQDVINNLRESITTSKNNISYLKDQIRDLERMKEVCANATENVINSAYDEEIKTAKAMFHSVKKDLATVVEIIVPEHMEFKDLLSDLAKAHSKGGDNMYIDVNPNILDCIELLVEADLVIYHRNDKTKIRLVDLV